MVIKQIKLFFLWKNQSSMLPYVALSLYIQTYLLSPQLRVVSLDLMGPSPSSIPREHRDERGSARRDQVDQVDPVESVSPRSGQVHPRLRAVKGRHNDVGARQKQIISFPLISALYIHPGDPAYSCAPSGVCRIK